MSWEDVEAIKQLKARYFRCLDTKDWDGYRVVFTEDVMVDVTHTGGSVFHDLDSFMAFVFEFVDGLRTVHQGHMPEITLTSATTATGIWVLEDRVLYANGDELCAQGHYFEVYEKSGGQWRIKEMVLTRLRGRIHGQETQWPEPIVAGPDSPESLKAAARVYANLEGRAVTPGCPFPRHDASAGPRSPVRATRVEPTPAARRTGG